MLTILSATYESASVVVARKESWRRMEIRKRMQEFRALTGIHVASQIVCVIIGDAEKTVKASQFVLSFSLC